MRPLLLSDQNNVSSANTYFGDRGDPNLYRGGVHLSSIEFPITFSGETVREDLAFPHPIETYLARDVTSLDWSTFVNFLFPMHNAARNGKLRQEQDPQHHSFIGEDTPARRDRILAVIAEWNESFFNPRRIHIKAHFSPLPSYPSSRSTVITPAVQSQHVGSQPFQPAPPTMYRDSPAHWSANLSATQPIHRSLSASSSGSSSSSSVDSIKSKDLEGVGLGQIRSAMLAFQLDATKKDHLRASVRQLRDDFRSQRQSLSGKDGKELKKESRNQRKEIKNEIKAAMKEVKAMRKVDRKIRKAERKCQGQSRRIEHRSNDRMKTYEDRGGRAEERAAERVRGAQERGREVEGRAEERAARAHYRAKEAQARGATAVARAQERVAVARARGWDSEARATQPRQELNARNGAAQQENGVLLRDD